MDADTDMAIADLTTRIERLEESMAATKSALEDLRQDITGHTAER